MTPRGADANDYNAVWRTRVAQCRRQHSRIICLNTGKPFLPGKPTRPWKKQTHTFGHRRIARAPYIIDRALTVTVPEREESYMLPLQRPILMVSFMTHLPSVLRYVFLGKPVVHFMGKISSSCNMRAVPSHGKVTYKDTEHI